MVNKINKNKTAIISVILIIAFGLFYIRGGFCPLAIKWTRNQAKRGVSIQEIKDKADQACLFFCGKYAITSGILKGTSHIGIGCNNKIQGKTYCFDAIFDSNYVISSVSDLKVYDSEINCFCD